MSMRVCPEPVLTVAAVNEIFRHKQGHVDLFELPQSHYSEDLEQLEPSMSSPVRHSLMSDDPKLIVGGMSIARMAKQQSR